MNAERHRIDVHTKEVTLLKRGVIVVVVFAFALLLAASAYASNGYRSTYTPSTVCSICHQNPGVVPAQDLVYNAWLSSAHSQSANNTMQISRGISCAGCHSGNYAPAKAVGVPVVTATSTAYPTAYPTAVDTTNSNNAFTEPDIGCSSCHYGTSAGGTFNTEADPADTAHMAPYGNLANPQICGQCHSHYSVSTTTYAYNPLPTAANPSPSPSATTAMYPLGYNGLGSAPSWVSDSLSADITIPTPSSPLPSISFWQGGQSKVGHEASGGEQYIEWAETLGQVDSTTGAPVTSHANAHNTIKAMMPDPSDPAAAANQFLNACLACHSTDYMLDEQADQATPTIATAQYGVTCVACHDPHSAPQEANGTTVPGTNMAAWDTADNPQLVAPESTLCTQCHTGQLADPVKAADGSTTYPMFAAGQDVHNATKEMMAGYGAIGGTGAAAYPLVGQVSVHEGDCVECHMVPTAYDAHSGAIDTGGNHVFAIVTPSEAASQTTSVTVSGVTTTESMPYSSCSTCHATTGNPLAQQMQSVMDNLQSSMETAINAVASQLVTDAQNLGYPLLNASGTVVTARSQADATQTIDGALAVINGKNQSSLSLAELNFQRAYTNMEFAGSEGSDGVHNPSYAPQVISEALQQAYAANPSAKSVAVKLQTGATTVASGRYVQFRTWVTPATAGSVVIQMQKGSSWVTFATLTAGANGFADQALKLTTVGTFNFRAYKAATATTAAGYSTAVRIVVTGKTAFVVKLQTSTTTVMHGRYVQFRTWVTPATAGPVVIQMQKGSSWVTFATLTAGANGFADQALKLSSIGTFNFRAMRAVTATHATGYSTAVKIAVK